MHFLPDELLKSGGNQFFFGCWMLLSLMPGFCKCYGAGCKLKQSRTFYYCVICTENSYAPVAVAKQHLSHHKNFINNKQSET
jgi:hypothetical protein